MTQYKPIVNLSVWYPLSAESTVDDVMHDISLILRRRCKGVFQEGPCDEEDLERGAWKRFGRAVEGLWKNSEKRD